MAEVNDLIAGAKLLQEKEEDRTLEIKVVFSYHGKLSQGWNHVRTLLRHGHLLFGSNVQVTMLDGEPITIDESQETE